MRQLENENCIHISIFGACRICGHYCSLSNFEEKKSGAKETSASIFSVFGFGVLYDSSYPYLSEWKEYKNNVMLSKSCNSVNIYYPGIGHMDICDLANSSPMLAAILGGTIADTDAQTNLTQLNNDCMTFLESLE